MLPVDEVGDEVHGAGTVEGHHGDDVFQPLRLEVFQGLSHSRGFQLEHAEGPALRQELVGLGVIEGDGVEVHGHPLGLPYQPGGVGEDRQGAEAEEVHLEEADLLDGPHGVAGDHLGPLRVLVERDVLDQRLVGDHDAGGVLGRVAGEPLQRFGGVPQLCELRAAPDRFRQLRRL